MGGRFPTFYTTVEEELNLARNKVAIADATPNGKIMVRGDQAEDFLNSTINLLNIAIHTGVKIAEMSVYRLRKDLFFISTLPGEVEVIL